MPEPLIKRDDYLDATDDAASQTPIDPAKFDDLIDAIIHVVNNELLRTSGEQEPVGDQNYDGKSLEKIKNITGVDSGDNLSWRMLYDEVNVRIMFQENTGTNESPVWADRFGFDLNPAGYVILGDNNGLVFPDGSQMSSEDFNSNGNVILTQDQNDIEFNSIIFGDWTISGNGSGNLEITNPNLDEPFLLNTDNEIIGMRLENRTSDPTVTSADAGRIWLRTDL